jgi:hypothetical protein
MLPFMQPLAYVAGGFSDPSTYVGGGQRNGVSQTTSLNLSGAAVGDYITFGCPPLSGATITGGDGAWTIGSGAVRTLCKRLSASDLASGLTCASYPWAFGIYRKPRTHADKGAAAAGFVKHARHSGLVVFLTSNATPSLSSPTGATIRQFASNGAGFVMTLYDLLSPATYTDGDDFIATSGGSTPGVVVLELLNSGTGAGAGPGGPFGSTDLSEDGNPMFNVLL